MPYQNTLFAPSTLERPRRRHEFPLHQFWLLPILVMMLVFGGLVVLTQGSAVAPFIYTIF